MTICTGNRIDYFGKVNDGKMILNDFGEIVGQQWTWLKKHYRRMFFDSWIVMPNHFHAIIQTKNVFDIVGTGRDLSLRNGTKSISGIIGAFKTTSSKLIHQSGNNSFRWQRSFYDHIIRNEESLVKIRQYIKNNPKNWEEDDENTGKDRS